MPQLYSKRHDRFLEHYLSSNEANLVGKNKERLIFGKNKAGYMFPSYITIKTVQSINQRVQFVANFRIDRNLKNAAYILTDKTGLIDCISSSCISLLKIDAKKIIQKNSNIQDFVMHILFFKKIFIRYLKLLLIKGLSFQLIIAKALLQSGLTT